MFLKDFHRFFIEELRPVYEVAEAAAITDMIFEALGGIQKQTIITQTGKALEAPMQQELEHALQRLKKGEPVQYVIGYAWFCNQRFSVSPAVLIPRPETEELVHWVLEYIDKNNPQKLLDIGTGSGCIPISIKLRAEEVEVTGIDVSDDALNIAQTNASNLGAAIHFIHLNFLDESTWSKLGTFDVIVSNPPYIPANEAASLHTNVTAHEPHLALFVADDERFIFYEKIAAFGLQHLNPGGCIWMETHASFAKEVQAIFQQLGYETHIKKDMFEQERMVVATLCR